LPREARVQVFRLDTFLRRTRLPSDVQARLHLSVIDIPDVPAIPTVGIDQEGGTSRERRIAAALPAERHAGDGAHHLGVGRASVRIPHNLGVVVTIRQS